MDGGANHGYDDVSTVGRHKCHQRAPDQQPTAIGMPLNLRGLGTHRGSMELVYTWRHCSPYDRIWRWPTCLDEDHERAVADGVYEVQVSLSKLQ